MAANINQIPTGIAQLLGIKQTGISPNILLPEVRAMLNLEEYYQVGQERHAAASAATGAVGIQAFVTVPQNEVWKVLAYSAKCTTAAGEASRFSCAAQFIGRNSAGTAETWAGSIGPDVIASASENPFAYSALVPLWLNPGDKLGVCVQQITTAGTITYAGYARYVPYKL